jgi:hypothetical protein
MEKVLTRAVLIALFPFDVVLEMGEKQFPR